jgi:uncharacterized protein (TIGR00369 family)
MSGGLDDLLATMEAAGAAGLRLPPPVFTELGGEFRAYDPDAQTLVVRFPVEERFQNPAGFLQGGIIAAAIDNAVGPLSYLVAPPSVTSQLDTTFLRPVSPADAFVEVEARLVERSGRQLVLDARVTNPAGETVALARATCVITAKRA